jgi:hypothetical protein
MDARLAFEEGVIIKLIERNTTELVSIDADCQKLIIDCLANLERIDDPNPLLDGRIDTVSISPELHDYREAEPIFKCFGRIEPVHPPAKAGGILG